MRASVELNVMLDSEDGGSDIEWRVMVVVVVLEVE